MLLLKLEFLEKVVSKCVFASLHAEVDVKKGQILEM